LATQKAEMVAMKALLMVSGLVPPQVDHAQAQAQTRTQVQTQAHCPSHHQFHSQPTVMYINTTTCKKATLTSIPDIPTVNKPAFLTAAYAIKYTIFYSYTASVTNKQT
jgi:hypothetical protein